MLRRKRRKKALAEAEAEDGVLKEKVQEEAAKEVETAAQAADLAEHSSNEKKAARQGDEQQGPSTSSDRERRHRQLLSKPVAHLVGFKNLQVILQPFVTVEHDGDIIEAPTFYQRRWRRSCLPYGDVCAVRGRDALS